MGRGEGRTPWIVRPFSSPMESKPRAALFSFDSSPSAAGILIADSLFTCRRCRLRPKPHFPGQTVREADKGGQPRTEIDGGFGVLRRVRFEQQNDDLTGRVRLVRHYYIEVSIGW